MPVTIERRTSNSFYPLIGDRNRLRRKDDIPLKETLKATISRTCQDHAYFTPVSTKQIEAELNKGYIRAVVNRQSDIVAHVRCLPLSKNASFLMSLYGVTREKVLEVLGYLGYERTISMETVRQHLHDLGLTELDFEAAGFKRAALDQLGIAYLARTNLFYLRCDPLKYVQGFFQEVSSPREYIVFMRHKNNNPPNTACI